MADAPEGFSGDVAAAQPPNTYILITGLGNNQTWISLPNAGQIWVALEGAADGVMIWHQGGQTTTVSPGFNTYSVGASDALVYPDPTSGPMKLGWAYL